MTILLARDHERMQGVHTHLVRVVIEARKAAPFIVMEGLRSRERQAKLVALGASRTMNSRHLTGHAVDLGYLGPRISIRSRLRVTRSLSITSIRSRSRALAVPMIPKSVWPRSGNQRFASGTCARQRKSIWNGF